MARMARLYRSSDEGAVIILAAVALLVLMGFVAFAVDYGVYWTARGQSQNAADSAAMAAAVSWAFDVPDAAAEDADEALKTLRATYLKESAVAVAQSNLVWTKAPSIDSNTDVLYPPSYTCPSGAPAASCFRINVYRDLSHSNALPVYFARLFGVKSQDMKATASAGVLLAGASDCLAPFALPDRWIEGDTKKFEQEKSKFQKYDDKGKDLKDPDIYYPPASGKGTGYKFTDAASKKLLKVDDFQIKIDKKTEEIKVKEFLKDGVKAKAYLQLEIPRKDGKESLDGYAENFASCNGQVIRLGDFVSMLNDGGKKTKEELNDITLDSIQALIDSDPKATYKNGKITNSCAQTATCSGASKNGKNGVSPRVVNVGLFDPDQWTDCIVGKNSCVTSTEVQIVNIVGFFVGCEKKDCKIKDDGKFTGAMMPSLGIIVSGPPPDEDFSFLRAIGIVR